MTGLHTGFRKSHQINTDSSELSRRHADSSGVISIWDTQMLLIDIHQLQIILAQSITLTALKDQVKNIWCVFCLDSQDILVASGAEHFRKRGEVETKRNVAIASVGGEAFCLQHHGDERDVGVVHCLEGDTGIIAVEVAILDEIFDGIDDLDVLIDLREKPRQPCSPSSTDLLVRGVLPTLLLSVFAEWIKM